MALMTPTTIRLDRKNIHAIGNLQGGREVHSLYLQQNLIEKIENLSCLPNLRFLSLAGNRIRIVENLHELQQLQFLDLSQNQIETLDADELPQSLLILNLTGNRCTNQDGYRELVLRALPRLLELDNQTVSNWRNSAPAEEEEEDKGGKDGAAVDTDSEEDYDISKLIGPFTAGKDFFCRSPPGADQPVTEEERRGAERTPSLHDGACRMSEPAATSWAPQLSDVEGLEGSEPNEEGRNTSEILSLQAT